METFTRWVYYFLESLGLDLSYMTNLNRLIVLVLIAVLAFLTDWICRKGIVRLVRKVTQKTKVTWDDLLFNDRVMNNFCHILPPVVVYILLPIAFPDGSDALAFIRKLCMVYIIAAALRFINIFLGVIFQLATQKEVFRDRPLKGVYQIIQVALFFVGSICIIAVLIEKSPTHLLAGLGASAAILMLVLCQREGFSASSSIIRYPIPNSFWIYGLSPGVLPNFLRIFAIFTCSFFVLL